MKTRFLIVLTTLACLGFSVSAFAGKDCPDGDTSPKCNRGGGGGGDDHGDPPAQYLAELTAGGFYFGSKVVTRNNRGNSYSSTEGFEMDRVADFPGDPVTPTDTVAWDDVFSTCPATWVNYSSPESVNVGDDWSIDNSGGNSSGDPGSRVTLAFRNFYTIDSDYSGVQMDLFLVGTLPEEFPTVPGNDIYIDLTAFNFYVDAHGNEDCKTRGTWLPGAGASTLKMTRYVP